MWTLVFALLFLLLIHQASEGTFRLPGKVQPAIAMIRVGRVSFRAWAYRPNRIYFTLAIGDWHHGT